MAVASLTGCSSWTNIIGGESAPPPAPAATAATPAAATPAPASASSASAAASFTSRVRSFFAGNTTTLPAAAAVAGAPAAPDIDCPNVRYRQGAGTYAISTPGAEPSALTLRYQASFVQTARECVVSGNQLTIKVGVQGRVVVGPAGGPGQLTIPLRYALLRQGLDEKTLWTKLFTVPVTIPDNQLNVPWLHIEQEMTVPLPPGDELEAYVIDIGFDPSGAAPEKPAARPRSARVR